MLPLDFQALFLHSPNAYMVVDRDLRYVAANDAYCEITASRREELLGRHVFDLFPHDPADANNVPARLLRESFARVLREKKPDSLALLPYRVPRLTETGSVEEDRFWSATHTPLLDAQGEVAFILQHTVDITDLHSLRQMSSQVEAGVLGRAQVVGEANRKLHGLFSQAPVAIAILRGSRHVVELANERVCRIWGRTQEQVLGRPVFDVLPEVRGQGFEELLNHVYTTGQRFVGKEIPAQFARLEGGGVDEAFLDFVYEALRDERGNIEGVIAVATDVTESVLARRRVEGLKAQAEEGVRLRDEFLSVASHELKTPLTPLALRLAQVRRTVQQPEVKAHLDVAERQVKKLAALVGELLDVARLTSGRLSLDLERLDLAALVRDVAARLEPEAERAGTKLVVEAEGEAQGHWDRLRLEQVVGNLLSNAIKYGGGRPVHVRVGRGNDRAVLSVRDEGIGIPEEAHGRIFDKFERAVSDRNYGGLGLGLYVTRQFTELMGGTVRVQSEPGQGATFYVELPLEAQGAAA